MKQKLEWGIVHDCDDEVGSPTCWVTELNSRKYGRFIWISKEDEDRFAIEYSPNPDSDMSQIVIYRSLLGAKRYVARYLT